MSGIHSNSVTIRPMHVIIGQPINNDQGYFSFKEGGLIGYTPGLELRRNSKALPVTDSLSFQPLRLASSSFTRSFRLQKDLD
jgi:hypothetical protein